MDSDFAARCRSDAIHSPNLEGNPLGSPAQRRLHVYLPPGYHEQANRRYPVIYYLHGYGSGAGLPTIPPLRGLRRAYPLVVRLGLPHAFGRLLTLDRLDRLSRDGVLPPFILVQPDASLHRPHLHGARAVTGEPVFKGSLYMDSPHTGRYGSYVFGDLVDHVDRSYRTIAEKSGRAVVGGSMGGYGALLGAILHPERFAAAAALSPSICCLDLLEITLRVPFMRRLLGRKAAARRGDQDVEDILETCDLIYSGDRPLLPSLRRDTAGRIVGKDTAAWERWAAGDAGLLADHSRGALSGVRLLVSCHEQDEFGFAGPCRRFSAGLHRLGVAHTLSIYDDPQAARLSPHTMGIAWHILPALRWCLETLGAPVYNQCSDPGGEP